MNKAVKELLKTAMKQDRVCAILEESEVEAILSTMEYFEFEQGSLIVEQGKMGTTFFVTDTGTLEVSVNGNVVNTLKEGKAFGGLALLYNCPRTATVQALSKAGVWGANGNNFKQVLAQNAANRQADNLKFLDSIKVFDGLNQKQKDQIALSAFSEAFEAGQRVATQGESLAAIYFVKRGGLSVMSGGEVKADGKFQGGVQAQKLSSGEYIGAALLLSQKQRPSWDHTLLADAKTELLCISVKDLKEVLGNDLGGILESALVQKGLRMCPVMSQFSSTQRNDIAKSVVIKDLKSGGALPDGVRYVIVLEGTISGMHKEEQVQGLGGSMCGFEQKELITRMLMLLKELVPAMQAVSKAPRGAFASALRFFFGLAVTALVLLALTSQESSSAAGQRTEPVPERSAPPEPEPRRASNALRSVARREENSISGKAPLEGAGDPGLAASGSPPETIGSPAAPTAPAAPAVAALGAVPSIPEVSAATTATAEAAAPAEAATPVADAAPAASAANDVPSVAALVSGPSWGIHGWNDSVATPVGKPPPPTGRVAYAWYLAGEPRQFEDYACAILVNAWFIKQNGLRPNADMVVVHFEEVPRRARFEKLGIKLIKVQQTTSKGMYQWVQSYLKLRVASLYQYDRIIYMDADSFPIGSLDNLFDLANFPVEIATPFSYWDGHGAMSGGPMVIDPRRIFYDRDFGSVLDTSSSLHLASEMDWVNKRFKDTISLLPGYYTMLIGEFCGDDGVHKPPFVYRHWQKYFGESAEWVLKHATVTLQRAQWLEDGGLLESNAASEAKSEIRNFVAGSNGARVGYLTKEGLLGALKELGLAAIGNAEEASDLTRKLIVAKKVHIFRHLSSEQINKLVQSFVLQRYRKGAHVIKQGEVGASFFVIASGDVNVEIDGKFIRTMTKNSYFGERALLFDEPRTATVEVSSPEAELWSIEKSTFSSIVAGKMQQELMHRIRLFGFAVQSLQLFGLDIPLSSQIPIHICSKALELCKQSPAPDLRLSKKLPDMSANPSTLSSFAAEFQPSGASPAHSMQNQYYSSSATYCQYQGQEQMQQGAMTGYYANTAYGYDCYQDVAYSNAAYGGDAYNQGYYGGGQYTNSNFGHCAKSAYNGRPRHPRAAAINLDDFSDISDSDSDAEIPAKIAAAKEKKVPDALETSSEAISEDAEPAEEPSPCAADEAAGLLEGKTSTPSSCEEDASSEAELSVSSGSCEPEEEELGPMISEEVASDPETVFSLKQMLKWRGAVLKSEEEPLILYRTQIVEEKAPVVKEPVPVTKTPKGKASSKSKAGKLEVSENSWAAQQRKLKLSEVSQDPCEQVARTIKSILNKLTLEKFAGLSQQLLQCGLRTSTHVEVLIHEVFEKATMQHHFIDMYTDLCVLLHEHFTAQPFEDCSGKADGRKMTFKRLLLDECQMSFERLLSPPEGLELLAAEDRTAAEVRYKTSMLGNIRLVGGLLSRGMLASRVGIAILEDTRSSKPWLRECGCVARVMGL
ncbi:PKAR [Symbiodinium sp. CCMP2456]|nr:PKAR [Symbiodinium sp. CCMP2456]